MFTNLLIQFAILVAGFVLLVKGADWFVDGAAGIAEKFGIPHLVVGLTIVAMGTSAPEAAVSITSAVKGSADLAVGNVLGSNIMNVALILGLSALLAPVAVQKSTIRIELPFMILISGIFLLLGWDEVITLVDGIILCVLFIVYLAYLFVMAKKNAIDDEPEEDKPVWKLLLLIVVGAAGIVGGAELAVKSASEIATIFGVSERIIGLTIVALGTSLPELVTSVTAARKGETDLAIGNIVGSNIFNVLFVIGLTALITNVPFAAAFRFDSIVGIGVAALLWVCCIKDRTLKRWGGALLLLAEGGYIASTFLL